MVDAQQALDKMNGFEIAGRPLRVGLVTNKGDSNPNRPNQMNYSNNPNNVPMGSGLPPVPIGAAYAAIVGANGGGGGGGGRPESLDEGSESLCSPDAVSALCERELIARAPSFI
jgi:RNA recognition motif-containing protein